jgi:hypothetical protein
MEERALNRLPALQLPAAVRPAYAILVRLFRQLGWTRLVQLRDAVFRTRGPRRPTASSVVKAAPSDPAASSAGEAAGQKSDPLPLLKAIQMEPTPLPPLLPPADEAGFAVHSRGCRRWLDGLFQTLYRDVDSLCRYAPLLQRELDRARSAGAGSGSGASAGSADEVRPCLVSRHVNLPPPCADCVDSRFPFFRMRFTGWLAGTDRRLSFGCIGRTTAGYRLCPRGISKGIGRGPAALVAAAARRRQASPAAGPRCPNRGFCRGRSGARADIGACAHGHARRMLM